MEYNQLKEIADSFKVRASATYEICAGEIGLTEKQEEKLAIYLKRAADFKNGVDKVKDLTDNMKSEMAELINKKDNPELPDGAKTHCKKWLKERLFGRRCDIKSKYIEKGNLGEEDGFTLMATELGLGMVYKHKDLVENEYIKGTPDLIVKKIVYDNKCSYTLDTFPMFESVIPDEKYEWQVNSYCDILKLESGVVAYTLIDAPVEIVEREVKWLFTPDAIYKRLCEIIYTKEYFDTMFDRFCPLSALNSFVEIPEYERVKPFGIKYDKSKTEKTYERVKMCRAYILELLIEKYNGKHNR